MFYEADSDAIHSYTIPYIQLNVSCVSVLYYCSSMGFVYNIFAYIF